MGTSNDVLQFVRKTKGFKMRQQLPQSPQWTIQGWVSDEATEGDKYATRREEKTQEKQGESDKAQQMLTPHTS